MSDAAKVEDQVPEVTGQVLEVTNEVLDKWATQADEPVALYLKQTLLPVEDSRIIFPPTYADIGYNIDTLADGTRVATIDSVGSQANRLEPIFKSGSSNHNDWLVPQIEIELDNGKTIALLDLAHRAADAVVLSSPELLELIKPAFEKLQKGNAFKLCAIAPTSLVFGVWDSRGDSGVKCPRLVRSIIRAWDVEVIHAAAQFNSVWKQLNELQQDELTKEAKDKKVKLSEKGLADAPGVFRPKVKAPQYVNGSPNPEARVLGGVSVKGRIEREVTVNLVALRNLRGKDDKGHDETAALRKYLLGLSLMAATADIELFLREGCLLRYAENSDTWWQVPRRGKPTKVDLSGRIIKDYAEKAAEKFRNEWPNVFKDKWPKDGDGTTPELKYTFNIEVAKNLLTKKNKEGEAGSESQS